MKKKDFFQDVKEKHWPKAKKELEKGIKNARQMLSAGEKQVRQFSSKSAERTRKITLQVKKERVVYDLGKAVARTPGNKWNSNKKIQDLRKEVKSLESEIRKIK